MSPDVAKEVPVAAALDGKGNSPKVYEPTPNTLTDPMSNIPDIVFIHEFLIPYRERASLRASERYGIKNE